MKYLLTWSLTGDLQMSQLLTVVQQLRTSEEAAQQQQHSQQQWQPHAFNPVGVGGRFPQPGGAGAQDTSLAAMLAQGQSSGMQASACVFVQILF